MLTAVDTNVVLRDLLLDSPSQAEIAEILFKGSKLLIVPTVLAELEWVLRSVYKWSRLVINDALQSLLDHENVSTTDDPRMRWALVLHRDGADLADVLHVAQAHFAERFVTFDSDFANRANIGGGTHVELLGP
jgi:predicted nucleic-acid-binding protein